MSMVEIVYIVEYDSQGNNLVDLLLMLCHKNSSNVVNLSCS